MNKKLIAAFVAGALCATAFSAVAQQKRRGEDRRKRLVALKVQLDDIGLDTPQAEAVSLLIDEVTLQP